PIPVDVLNYRGSPAKRSVLKRALFSLISALLRNTKLRLVEDRSLTPEQRAEGRTWSSYGDTMIGLKRLDSLQRCIETVLKQAIPGDFIETGAWRGGASIFMRAVLAAYGIADRRIFVADSFQGLPKPDTAKWPVDRRSTFHIHPFLAISEDEVRSNFRKYDLLDDQVVFLPGWFSDTLPSAPIEQLAILRFDGDMYGSTMDVLTNLYPKLSKGGFCIIDDYGLRRCQQAVDDFRASNHITAEITRVDWTGILWRKGED
ncbi:MAG TPA: TylF/MycF/NovP-related O-methyltransferase, partial [Candidatus Kryptonia bacterium]|nr:TylF/MycF/NovP-related O-methyltransferase [Candidatus Kryptonia bacterium]